MSDGTLKAIWIKRMKRGPMDSVANAKLVTGRGLVGNANQGGKRQVTIIEREMWQKVMQQMHSDIAPQTRRANLMVENISLARTRGQILQIGNCRIRIIGETRPCERMDEALNGLREALKADWGGGAYGEVLDDGEIKVGDIVCWAAAEPVAKEV